MSEARQVDGASHAMTPNGPMPVDDFNEASRERWDEAQRTIPRNPPPAPRPFRHDLEAALATAKSKRQQTLQQLQCAEAALAKGQQIVDQTRIILRELDEEEVRREETLTAKIRGSIRAGALGDQPRAAKLSVGDVQIRQQIEANAAAAEGALAGLEQERDLAQQDDNAVYAAMCDAARAILVLDALEIADRVAVLKAEIIALQDRAWGHAFCAVPIAPGKSAPLKCSSDVTMLVNVPPIPRDLPAAVRTERGKREVELVRARFDALIGDPVSAPDDGEPATTDDAPEAA